MPAIARLVQADEDTIRQVIHRFNEVGMASLDPQWAGGHPRLISPDEETLIVATANIRPEALGRRSPGGASAARRLPRPRRPPARSRSGGNGCGSC
ncbi:helix-turn-helix domain-containing protein [Micromonospora sp. SL1-18]|uniref:helix-turn-helix domain-containing protein n=1 Tax=Micromonospora sp. SL1-18 TaxID=3399128 RepID=UPI003A4D2E73